MEHKLDNPKAAIAPVRPRRDLDDLVDAIMLFFVGRPRKPASFWR
jgi:hypothetical protein